MDPIHEYLTFSTTSQEVSILDNKTLAKYNISNFR